MDDGTSILDSNIFDGVKTSPDGEGKESINHDGGTATISNTIVYNNPDGVKGNPTLTCIDLWNDSLTHPTSSVGVLGTDFFNVDPEFADPSNNDYTIGNPAFPSSFPAGCSVGLELISATPPDLDGDGVQDDVDVCLGTSLPDVPTVRLGVNRFADVDGDGIFDTMLPRGGGRGPQKSFTIDDTAGCSCEQIIEELGLGQGHTKFGCSISAMEDFITQLD